MEMIPFTYQDSPVRTVENDGHILFCGKDVATALGYKDPTSALKLHCKGVAKHHPLQTPGGIQQFRFITEGDLYRLVASSKLPTAQHFESWVFDEVLPSIRKRGGYLTPEAAAEALTDPDFIIRLATDLKAERAKRAQLEEARKAERPKVLFADSVATSDSTILVGDLAKIIKGNGMEIGANRLFARLREDGFLIKRKGTDWNMPTQRAMELGLFKIKESSHIHSDGHVTISKTPKVTGKGQTYLVNHYLKEMAK
jgi:anti-repressor protein